MKDKAEKIAQDARKSISNYCIDVCKAKCCKKGKIPLISKDEVKFMTLLSFDDALKQKKIEITQNGNYLYNHEINKCKYLTCDNLCDAHTNSLRPKVCQDFPLALIHNKNGNFMFLSREFCPAAKEGLLDKYIANLKKLNYKDIL